MTALLRCLSPIAVPACGLHHASGGTTFFDHLTICRQNRFFMHAAALFSDTKKQSAPCQKRTPVFLCLSCAQFHAAATRAGPRRLLPLCAALSGSRGHPCLSVTRFQVMDKHSSRPGDIPLCAAAKAGIRPFSRIGFPNRICCAALRFYLRCRLRHRSCFDFFARYLMIASNPAAFSCATSASAFSRLANAPACTR